ncbi:hypothetical protein [Pseudoalteromonas fuliginea]|uniref:hypothetical protein n=1 Tax=Pseudoalteromonas fuliginea TaxID=1872678 RepID=UPI00316FF334
MNKWLDEQNISEEAISVFKESLVCYGAQAWRSSLLMSYVGFLTIIRDRILEASPPVGFTVLAWEQKGRDLRNPDKWDANAFSCTQQKSPEPLFLVTDDLRHQVTFWKNRRNDCAHSKPNLITEGHVESFYSFLISNSSKFVVNGSRNSVLGLIKDHFNPDKTPPNTPLDYLINKVNTSVEQSELGDFIDDVLSFFDDNRTRFENITGAMNQNKINFIDASYRLGSTDFKASIMSKLVDLPELIVEVLRKNSQFTNELNGHAQLVRILWRRHLFLSERNDSNILCSMLNNNLIPQGELDEVFEIVFEKDIQPNELELMTLTTNGFHDFVRDKIDSGVFRNFAEANSARKHIIGYFDSTELDATLCNKLYDDFDQTWVADDLASAFNRYFSENSHKVAEYKSHGLECPRELRGL